MRRILPLVLLVAAASFAAGGVIAGVGAKTWANPDIGRSPQEVERLQKENTDAFWARYAGWVDEQNQKQIDPRAYKVTEIMASTGAPAANLSEAVRTADLTIVGIVKSVQFRATADSVVEIQVTETLRGTSASATIQVVQLNSLVPDRTWSSATIGVVEATPMLYPEDRVVLILHKDLSYPGAFNVQLWTGTYRETQGQLRAVVGNPFAATVEATSFSDFVAGLRGT